MKLLNDQVIAGTGLDRHGESISEEVLHRLFKQLPDPNVMHSEHNRSNRPVCRSFNKRLQRIENGELAIVVDVEVYDESAFEEVGGFSISFTGSTFTANEHCQPDIRILYNPRLFPTPEVLHLVRLSTDKVQINATELHQKALDIPFLIVVIFATAAAATGFFNAMGQDAYGAVKTFLISAGKRIRNEHNADLICQFSFIATELDNKPEILVSISSEMLDQLSAMGVSAQDIMQELGRHCTLGEVIRASLTLVDDCPTWKVEYVMNAPDKVPDVADGDA